MSAAQDTTNPAGLATTILLDHAALLDSPNPATHLLTQRLNAAIAEMPTRAMIWSDKAA